MRTVFFYAGFILSGIGAMLSCARAVETSSSAAPLEWSREAFTHDVMLVEAKPDEPRLFSTKDIEARIRRALTADEKALLERDDTGAWRRYADDLLAFDLPEDPLLQVRVVLPGDGQRLSFVGYRAGTTDNRFQRAYRITVGTEVPYLLVLVSDAGGFDNGICLCGAIVFEKLQVVDGQARRFSLLYSGAVKKVQVLGGEHRAVLMEWTHTTISQSAYARMAASIRFTDAKPRSLKAWEEVSPGWERVGWLERGDDTARLKALMGQPTRVDGDRWIYVRDERFSDGRRHRSTLTVPMPGTGFPGFREPPSDGTELPPVDGSLAWAEMVVGSLRNADGSTPPVARTSANKRRVLERFIEEGNTSASADWDRWCGVAGSLHEQGIRDERVPAIVERRYAEVAQRRTGAARLLERYRITNRDTLFAARAEVLLERTSYSDAFELDELYGFLGRDFIGIEGLIQRGLNHGSAPFRSTALRHANKLDSRQAADAARRALETDNDETCRVAAAHLVRRIAEPADLPWLEARISREPSKKVRTILAEAVRQLMPKQKPASRGARK